MTLVEPGIFIQGSNILLHTQLMLYNIHSHVVCTTQTEILSYNDQLILPLALINHYHSLVYITLHVFHIFLDMFTNKSPIYFIYCV